MLLQEQFQFELKLGNDARILMKHETWRKEWHLITNEEAHEVTGSTSTPNAIFPYDLEKLPAQLQKLPGLYAAYISGYATSSLSPEDVSVLGEVAAVRSDDGIGKGYVWVFGVSGSGVYINGPYKFFASMSFGVGDSEQIGGGRISFWSRSDR